MLLQPTSGGEAREANGGREERQQDGSRSPAKDEPSRQQQQQGGSVVAEISIADTRVDPVTSHHVLRRTDVGLRPSRRLIRAAALPDDHITDRIRHEEGLATSCVGVGGCVSRVEADARVCEGEQRRGSGCERVD